MKSKIFPIFFISRINFFVKKVKKKKLNFMYKIEPYVCESRENVRTQTFLGVKKVTSY